MEARSPRPRADPRVHRGHAFDRRPRGRREHGDLQHRPRRSAAPASLPRPGTARDALGGPSRRRGRAAKVADDGGELLRLGGRGPRLRGNGPLRLGGNELDRRRRAGGAPRRSRERELLRRAGHRAHPRPDVHARGRNARKAPRLDSEPWPLAETFRELPRRSGKDSDAGRRALRDRRGHAGGGLSDLAPGDRPPPVPSALSANLGSDRALRRAEAGSRKPCLRSYRAARRRNDDRQPPAWRWTPSRGG